MLFFEQSFYIRLITIADDYGRYEAHPALLASECFPYGDDQGLPVLALTIEGMLRSLASKDLLFVYESDAKSYFQLTRWKERIRLEKGSHYPDPTKAKVIWKCQSHDWQMSDRCLSDVGNPENGQVPEKSVVRKNDSQVTGTCQQIPASPPTPTPVPTPTPTPTPVHTHPPTPLKGGKSVSALKKEFQDNGRFEWLEAELTRFYKRPRPKVGMGEEEHLVSEVSRRPDVKEEWKILQKYRAEIGEKFFPQSLRVLCQDWDKTLDKARNHAPPPTPFKDKSVAEKSLEAFYRKECGV